MYFIKRFYHIEHAATSKREAFHWLREHAGVSWWEWVRGKLRGYRLDRC